MSTDLVPYQQAKYLKHTWVIINFCITVIGILSLFGHLGEITFHQWIERVIQSYRSIIYPIIDFFDFFSLNLSNGQKDIFALIFFVGNRYISVIFNKFKNDNYAVNYWKNKLKISTKQTIVFIKIFVHLFFLMICIMAFWFRVLSEKVNQIDNDTFVTLLLCGLFLLPFIIILYQLLDLVLTPKIKFCFLVLRYKIRKKYKTLRKLKLIIETIKSNKIDFKYYAKALTKVLLINSLLALATLFILAVNYYLNLSA